MTMIDMNWEGLNKREIIQRARDLDLRRQQQISRQIDSINRLLEATKADNPGSVPPYEHELMTLNEQLATKDIRVAALERALGKVSQMVRDRLNAADPPAHRAPTMRRFLERLYEVLVDEAGMEPYDDAHGRTSAGSEEDHDEDRAGSPDGHGSDG